MQYISHFGSNSLRYPVSKIWNKIQPELKILNGVEMFKSQFRKWGPARCKCKLCLPYMKT